MSCSAANVLPSVLANVFFNFLPNVLPNVFFNVLPFSTAPLLLSFGSFIGSFIWDFIQCQPFSLGASAAAALLCLRSRFRQSPLRIATTNDEGAATELGRAPLQQRSSSPPSCFPPSYPPLLLPPPSPPPLLPTPPLCPLLLSPPVHPLWLCCVVPFLKM